MKVKGVEDATHNDGEQLEGGERAKEGRQAGKETNEEASSRLRRLL